MGVFFLIGVSSIKCGRLTVKVPPIFQVSLYLHTSQCDSVVFPHLLNLNWTDDMLWPIEGRKNDSLPVLSLSLKNSCMLPYLSLENMFCHSGTSLSQPPGYLKTCGPVTLVPQLTCTCTCTCAVNISTAHANQQIMSETTLDKLVLDNLLTKSMRNMSKPM